MPRKNRKQAIGQHSTIAEAALATASRKPRKAPGTRTGILQDWREGSTFGKAPDRVGNTLRDGR